MSVKNKNKHGIPTLEFGTSVQIPSITLRECTERPQTDMLCLKAVGRISVGTEWATGLSSAPARPICLSPGLGTQETG